MWPHCHNTKHIILHPPKCCSPDSRKFPSFDVPAILMVPFCNIWCSGGRNSFIAVAALILFILMTFLGRDCLVKERWLFHGQMKVSKNRFSSDKLRTPWRYDLVVNRRCADVRLECKAGDKAKSRWWLCDSIQCGASCCWLGCYWLLGIGPSSRYLFLVDVLHIYIISSFVAFVVRCPTERVSCWT